MKPIIAAFDFDGTITRCDTFLPFLSQAFGRWPTLRSLLVASPVALGGLARSPYALPRNELKARVIHTLFAGASATQIDQSARSFARQLPRHFRPLALTHIAWHRAQGHRLVLVSASLEVYLQYVARDLGFDDLLCTRLTQIGDFYDGTLLGENCRSQEKTARLTERFGPLTELEIYAYGDSRGDREMLAAATHPHFRPFRQ